MTGVEADVGWPAAPGVSEPGRISIRSLTKRYDETLAVDDLSFDAAPARVTAFLGLNGAGKSTTLRMLLGLLAPTTGTATIGGQSFRELRDAPRTVGAVMEESTFNPGRTGRSHLRVLTTMARLPSSRVDEVLAIVDLTDVADRHVGKYSMGMRQRLGLATALLGNPQALVLDEPANGLDPPGIRWLRDFLRAEADRGTTVLYSSHVLSEVAQLADDLVVINKGRLVRAAPMDELLGDKNGRYRIRTPDAKRLGEELANRGIEVNVIGDELVVAEDAVATAISVSAQLNLTLHQMGPDDTTLEDAFLQLLSRASGDVGSG